MVSPVRLKKPAARVSQREFPFVVQLVVPDGGFGCTLDAINAWHHYKKNTQRRGPPQRFGEREFWSWGFEGLEIAKSFRQHFGGEIVPLTIQRCPERHCDSASVVPAAAKSECEMPERTCEIKRPSSIKA
ncbi:MAG TPA: hypothetical protein VE396_02415 [Xanthobacteraceae bacterium]|nr:hypothetical protein [Xanthobacteraceae bacterium]